MAIVRQKKINVSVSSRFLPLSAFNLVSFNCDPAEGKKQNCHGFVVVSNFNDSHFDLALGQWWFFSRWFLALPCGWSYHVFCLGDWKNNNNDPISKRTTASLWQRFSSKCPDILSFNMTRSSQAPGHPVFLSPVFNDKVILRHLPHQLPGWSSVQHYKLPLLRFELHFVI